MVAAQKDTSKKEEKPVKKAEKKETPVADTPKDEAAPKETAVDRKTVRAFLADKSRSGKTSEVKNLIEQFGFQKLSDVPDEKLPELNEKAQQPVNHHRAKIVFSPAVQNPIRHFSLRR